MATHASGEASDASGAIWCAEPRPGVAGRVPWAIADWDLTADEPRIRMMATPPPPISAHRGPGPPPPNLAQQLVARSGFVLYEGGRSVFDESVLVYQAKHKSSWPNCDITDHVGRTLGLIRRQGRGGFAKQGPAAVFDPGGAELLRVAQGTKRFNFVFDVTGVASARYETSTIGGREMVIEANNERFGSIRGPAYRGMTASTMEILDQNRNPVGGIRSISAGSSFSSWDHYVMSIKPHVGGELRRLLIAAPLVIAFAKRAQQSRS